MKLVPALDHPHNPAHLHSLNPPCISKATAAPDHTDEPEIMGAVAVAEAALLAAGISFLAIETSSAGDCTWCAATAHTIAA